MPDFYNYSQIITHNRCRWLWQVQYQRGIQPLMPQIRMDIGTAVHAGLAAYFANLPISSRTVAWDSGIKAIEDWADELLPGWRDVVLDYEEQMDALDKVMEVMEADQGSFSADDILSLSIAPVVERAKEIYKRTVVHIGDNWEVLMFDGLPIVEREFTHKNVLCHVDLAVRDKNTGLKMVVDFKVRQNLQPEEAADFDLQTAIYQYVLQANGIPITATAMMQIRSVTPRQPKLNKNGSMSRTDIITDWPTYEAALLANNLDPADYGDMMMKLAGKKFFQLDMTYRGKERLDAIWDQVVQPAIRELKLSERRYKGKDGLIPASRNMSNWNCAGCRFRDLCMAELEDMDTSYMFGTMYEHRERTNGR